MRKTTANICKRTGIEKRKQGINNKWNKHLAKETKRTQNYDKKVRETLMTPKSTPPLPSPYQTPQTIGKAIKKDTQLLSCSLRKKLHC